MCLFFTNLLRLQNRIKLVRKRLYVLAYIERTKDEEMFDFCFFSLHKLHKAEISYTIARWIKHVFTSFRIHGFGAPSTQELQHQLLLRLVGLWTILWVLQIGLNKFYKRSKDDRSKGKLVLQSCSKWMRSVFYIFEFCIFSYECTKTTKDDLQLEKGKYSLIGWLGLSKFD